MMVDFVVARWNEDIDWTEQLPGRRFIYNKGDAHVAETARLANVGREAHSYLSHIVLNYDSLADFTVFCQGNTLDHAPQLFDRLRTMNNSFGFLTNRLYACDWTGFPHHCGLPIREVWDELLGGKDKPFELEFGPGAIFYVRNEVIRRYGIALYRKAVEIAESRMFAPWVFERMWGELFNSEEIGTPDEKLLLPFVEPPTVFYHVAEMGDWRQVIAEQLSLLKDVGLCQIKSTYLGSNAGLCFFKTLASEIGIEMDVLMNDENILHYETFAMLMIEKWAASNDGAVLYLHTKGVSSPGHQGKVRWRRLMQDTLIKKWRRRMHLLNDVDAVGVNWRHMGNISHFCGNFWLARSDYLRTLPSFVRFHNDRELVRTNCEFWIGSSPRAPKIVSLVDCDADYCAPYHFG